MMDGDTNKNVQVVVSFSLFLVVMEVVSFLVLPLVLVVLVSFLVLFLVVLSLWYFTGHDVFDIEKRFNAVPNLHPPLQLHRQFHSSQVETQGISGHGIE